MVGTVQADLDAQDLFTATGTDTQDSSGTVGLACSSRFGLHIEGTFSGTLTLQRSKDDGVTWYDIATFTTPTDPDQVVLVPIQAIHRIGFKTGEYTSGTATCILDY